MKQLVYSGVEFDEPLEDGQIVTLDGNEYQVLGLVGQLGLHSYLYDLLDLEPNKI